MEPAPVIFFDYAGGTFDKCCFMPDKGFHGV
jgi:hypothetical protein